MWLEQNALLWRCRHPHLVATVDYGPIAGGSMFAAWDAPVSARPWLRRNSEATRAVRSAARFLVRQGLSPWRATWRHVVDVEGRPMLLPVAPAGRHLETTSGGRDAGTGTRVLAGCGPRGGSPGVVLKPPDQRADIVELLETGRPGGPRHLHLSAGAGTELSVVVTFAARDARVRGFIPLSTACLASSSGGRGADFVEAVLQAVRNRHVFVIHDRAGSSDAALQQVVRLVLALGTTSGRPHLVIAMDTRSRALHSGARLGPGTWNGQGLPPGGAVARASEPRLDYGAADRSGPAVGPLGQRATAASTHERARIRAAEGFRLAMQGRHAAGERLLREAAGALARRGDHASAGRTAMDLGRLLQWRGRVREAAAAFEQARGCFDRCGWSIASIGAAIYQGLVWTDSGRLVEAESALRAALIAAREAGSAFAGGFAHLALARCLVWQRRWEEAASTLADPQREGGGPGWAPQAVRCREGSTAWRWDDEVDAGVVRACLESRIAIGRGDLAAAGLWATRAGESARQAAGVRDLTMARTAAARVHAEIADVDGLCQHVHEGLRAAARAHAPLDALRLRLLLVDGYRRAHRYQDVERLARRLARLRKDCLPALLRRRVEAICRGQLSTEVMVLPLAASPSPADVLTTAQAPGAWRAGEAGAAFAADIAELLQAYHEVEDEAAVLDRLAGHLRQCVRASAVAFIGVDRSEFPPVAGAGIRPFPVETARRACETGLAVVPSGPSDRIEAAVPVRYAGAIIGALVCRWPADMTPDEGRVLATLSTAAALAAPGLRAALDRRSVPLTVLAAEPDLMGVGDLMTHLRTAIARAAATPFPVLVEGESGSGKELVAKAIHRLSARRDRKYCAVNCAALTDELLEAELFGHARGAFTGAVGERAGLLEDADGGTLVLDEVRDLSPRAQAKLLRALQEGEVRRVGENTTRTVDVRIITATNRPLHDEVAAGRFRRDLFYRLAVIRLVVPPLRDRVEDIPLLAAHFWAQAVAKTGSRATLAPATVAALARHNWPGNVRELQNVMAALAVSAPRRGAVGPASLPPAIAESDTAGGVTTLADARRAFEVRHVRAALARTGGHRGRAARDLGLSRQGFAKALARLRVDASDAP